MRRGVLVFALVVAVAAPGTAKADPPFEYASGAAEPATGLVAALALSPEVPATEGRVGRYHPPGFVHALAFLDVVQVAAGRASAWVCLAVGEAQACAVVPDLGSGVRVATGLCLETAADVPGPGPARVEVLAGAASAGGVASTLARAWRLVVDDGSSRCRF